MGIKIIDGRVIYMGNGLLDFMVLKKISLKSAFVYSMDIRQALLFIFCFLLLP